jgi:hypothetical protein
MSGRPKTGYACDLHKPLVSLKFAVYYREASFEQEPGEGFEGPVLAGHRDGC